MQVSKYSASGNDFVIFHTLHEENRSDLAVTLCDRHEGVGADGLVVLLPHEKYDFKWQFYNSDGSDASMCGNATRAVAHYAFNNALAKKDMAFLTKAGLIHSSVGGDVVESELTTPKTLQEPFEKEGKIWHFYDTGVPHLVTYTDDLITSWDENLIKLMRHEYNANVNFVKITKDELHIRTFERGVEGETLACGTGIAAAFLGAFRDEKVGLTCKVIPKSGEELQMQMRDEKLFFKGRVKHSFDAVVGGL